MGENLFAAFRDFQPVKEVAVIDLFTFFSNFILKETTNHELVQRLAEAPRTGKQGDFRSAFD